MKSKLFGLVMRRRFKSHPLAEVNCVKQNLLDPGT